jgi:hypothetical protein
MAKNFGRVNVSITASTGGLTAGLASAGKQLSGFQGLVSRMTGGMGSGFASATLGVLGLGRGASTAAVGVAILSGAMKSLLIPLGVIAAVTAPFVALASAASAAEKLHNLSQEMGVSSSELQVLTQVADEFGVSQEQMTTGLRRSSRMVGELANGTPAAVKAFQRLGLTMQDMAGKDAAEQFRLISQRIAALPPAMQQVAAVNIFGRSGQSMLNFIRGAGDASEEVKRLQQALGVTLSPQQTAAIESMGDAFKRLVMPVQGFINQFLAKLAPAITVVSNMIVGFFAENTNGWSLASAAASAFEGVLRGIVGRFTVLYGVIQLVFAINAKLSQAFNSVFSVILEGVRRLSTSLAGLAEAAGLTDMAASLRETASGAAKTQKGFDALAKERGELAAKGFAKGIENITNPFGAFDAALAKAKAGGGDGGEKPRGEKPVPQAVGAAIKASVQELRAIVVGSSEGEAFRNNIMRGADPRLDVKDDARKTADNTERAADALDDIAARLDPTGLAVIG